MVIRPYGYAIWENIQRIFRRNVQGNGTRKCVYAYVYPKKPFLQKEKDHVEGFAPEVAWVTRAETKSLRTGLRTSDIKNAFHERHYSNIVHSYRDLPKLYNQSELPYALLSSRWEKTTKTFPPFKRIFMAGGAYNPRNSRGSSRN